MDYYLNGSFVQADAAKIPITDLGILRGFGIFEYLRTYNGHPFHLREHLLRLQYSAQTIGLTLSHSLKEIEEIIAELLRRNPLPMASIKILATGGESCDQLMPTDKTTLCILAYPFTPFPERCYIEGIRLITTDLIRPFPTAKTTQYISAIVALRQAQKRGADDALYLNDKQEILEATTSNFFAFRGNTLLTSNAPEILRGITRAVALRLAATHFSIEEGPITLADPFDEAFICSSSREIMPVVQIEDRSFPIGPKTKELMNLFTSYAKEGRWDHLSTISFNSSPSILAC